MIGERRIKLKPEGTFNRAIIDVLQTQIEINNKLEERLRILEIQMLNKAPPKKNELSTNTRAVKRLLRDYG